MKTAIAAARQMQALEKIEQRLLAIEEKQEKILKLLKKPAGSKTEKEPEGESRAAA